MATRLVQTLSLGQFFNQPLARVVWPASLQQLLFGEYRQTSNVCGRRSPLCTVVRILDSRQILRILCHRHFSKPPSAWKSTGACRNRCACTAYRSVLQYLSVYLCEAPLLCRRTRSSLCPSLPLPSHARLSDIIAKHPGTKKYQKVATRRKRDCNGGCYPSKRNQRFFRHHSSSTRVLQISKTEVLPLQNVRLPSNHCLSPTTRPSRP